MINPDPITRIARDASGRYRAGLPLTEAITGACSGHVLDVAAQQHVEKLATVFAADDPVSMIAAELYTAAMSVTIPDIEALVRCAANGELYRTQIAVLAALAHNDRLWRALVLARTCMDFAVPGGSEHNSVRAHRQSVIATQIRSCNIDERIRAMVELLRGQVQWTEVERIAIAAVLRAEPIYDAHTQVRTAIEMLR
jgi:hypothetical protein